ncbi:Protein kinase-like domain [Phytophthora cactorum]|nr:Protein kinase-like domain [Phytophthora cactorum]
MGIKTTLDVLGIVDSEVENKWKLELQKEREQRVDIQQLELLTLMKHGVDKFGDVLSPVEMDLITQVFDEVVRSSNIVVGTVPDWFATDERGWSRSDKSFIAQEEACLRHVETWAPLHHPHVRKFYGACHVGRPYVIHELTVSRYPGINSWFYMFGCALGLKYVHERGLVHEKLSFDNLQSLYEFKGMLSGLGLTRIDGETSIEADVLAFGLVMFAFLVDSFSKDDAELEDLSERSDSRVSTHLLQRGSMESAIEMCADNPDERLNMIESSCQDIWSDEEDFGSSPPSVDNVDAYILPDAGITISEALQDADEMCDEVEDLIVINRPVYNRLLDVYEQLAAVEDSLPLTLVEDYGSIVWRFYLRLEARSQGDYSQVATLCAANTIANRNYGLHHDIDRLILSTKYLQNNAAIHHWQPHWKQTTQWQQEALQKCYESYWKYYARPEMVDSSPPDRTGTHLADGSFGAVYLGKWFNTDVVVKQFFHEVNLWASLNHDNLIKLYGACHEGQPFFVCERADEGTLVKYSEERRQFPTWRAIWEAAKGLEYLHERGIVHGDLKGNNILVCDGTAKLADFGLSAFAKAGNSGGVIGAFRWKAPECLAGSGPTLASDIYSFAMCIIEVISGGLPWGKTMQDSAVVSNVLHKRKMPQRPKGFTDDQWDLVTRMCTFDPQSRPNATALVHLLWKFA